MEVIGKRSYRETAYKKAKIALIILASFAALFLVLGLAGIFIDGFEIALSIVLLVVGGLFLLICVMFLIGLNNKKKKMPATENLVLIDSENLYLTKREGHTILPLLDILKVERTYKGSAISTTVSWADLIITTKNKEKHTQTDVADIENVMSIITNAIEGKQ